jgi:hypothetical protein
MANHPKLIKLPGSFEDAVSRLLNTPPPPREKKPVRKRAKKGARKKAR